jgi:hypothetical protein
MATIPTKSSGGIALAACPWGVIVHGQNLHINVAASGDLTTCATLFAIDKGGLEHKVARNALGYDHALDTIVCVSVL